MRERLYLTYDSKKDKAYTHNWINRAVEIDKIPRYKLDVKYVKRLCSALSYSSLFLLPEHMLYNGAKYTIPEICIRYQGIVASELYSMLKWFGNIAITDDVNQVLEYLAEIIKSPLYPEVFAWLGLNAETTYLALAASYASISGDIELLSICCDDLNYMKALRYINVKMGGIDI